MLVSFDSNQIEHHGSGLHDECQRSEILADFVAAVAVVVIVAVAVAAVAETVVETGLQQRSHMDWRQDEIEAAEALDIHTFVLLRMQVVDTGHMAVHRYPCQQQMALQYSYVGRGRESECVSQ